MEWLFNRTLGSFYLVTCYLHYTVSRVATERERAWRVACGRFAWPVLEAVDIISASLPLARAQSRGHAVRGLGDV